MITGHKAPILVTKEMSSAMKRGKRAKALCEGPWKTMKCTITFNKFIVNQEELKKVLNEKYSPIEAVARYNLLLKFSNDPIGLAVIK